MTVDADRCARDLSFVRAIGCALLLAACAGPPKKTEPVAPPARPPPVVAAEAVASADPAAAAVTVVPDEELPESDRVNSVLSALDGVCTRSRVSEEGRTRVGCESCPGGWGKKAPRPAIGSSAPELEVLRVFEADLLGTGSRIAVLSYTGCQPGIFGYAGTLVVDTDSKKLLRDEAGLDLTRCRAYPSAGRETLVCVAELEHQKGMAGKTDYALGVYDPVDLRAVDSDDPADIAAWHSIPLASSDAAYDCISGGPPPGAPIRFVRVLGLAVDPESARVTVRGLSAAGPSTKAFEEACAAEADPGDALGATGFAIDFQLAGKELVPTAGAQRWLSKHR